MCLEVEYYNVSGNECQEDSSDISFVLLKELFLRGWGLAEHALSAEVLQFPSLARCYVVHLIY